MKEVFITGDPVEWNRLKRWNYSSAAISIWEIRHLKGVFVVR
jgi:hypothetical protein